MTNPSNKGKCPYCEAENISYDCEPTKGVGGEIIKLRYKYDCGGCSKRYSIVVDVPEKKK